MRKTTTNKGNSILTILVLIAFFALPMALRNWGSPTKENNATSTTSRNYSWFSVFTPTTEELKPTVKQELTKPKIDEPIPTERKEANVIKPEPIRDPNMSTYDDKIIISSLSGTGKETKSEYLVIKNKDTNESINITGFKIETSANESFTIPTAYNLPGFDVASKDNIILKPGGELYINVGHQDRGMNFRENICTGYFDETSSFNGALTHRCPKIEVPNLLNFSDLCIKTLNSIQVCRTPGSNMIVDNDCNQFLISHYSYASCVRDNKNRDDFYLDRWLVWMQRGIEFFRNIHDLIILKDQNGKIVDDYQY